MALWRPRQVDAMTLKSRLRVEVNVPSNLPDRITTWDDAGQLFLRFVQWYLEGNGHPEHENTKLFAGLSTNDFERKANNLHIRACLLLEAFTESKICPEEDVNWNLKVSGRYIWGIWWH